MRGCDIVRPAASAVAILQARRAQAEAEAFVDVDAAGQVSSK